MAQRTVTADAVTNPFAGHPAEIAAGKILYEQTCQSCHGGEARGDRSPALANGSFKHGGEDTEIFQTIRTGVPGTQMPAFSSLPTDNVWRIITYLRSLSGNNVGLVEVVSGNVALGEKIFRTKGGCTACHEVNGRGGIVGPDLSAIGTKPVEYLRSMIVNPNEAAQQRGRFSRTATLTVKTRDGQQFRGIRVAEDTYNLILMDSSGKTHKFNTQDLLETHEDTKSLMPDNYAQLLSQGEIQDVVAYLATLKVRDVSKAIKADIPGGLTFERLRNAHAEPQNWLTYWGDYQGHHFSTLKEISTANVSRLQPRWALQTPGDSILEATPLVVDGTMYTTGVSGQVYSIDAKSGLQIWNYERRQKVVNPYQTNPFNRGVALLGNRVFVGTLDAALVSLDARTGRVLWETQIADTLKGYTITGAPLAVKGMVIVGVAGGEFGIRGFLDAYDAATGKRLWRFNAIPGPGEFGNDTWSGDSWKQGSGGTWLTGSYDAELDTLYWTVGNPGPNLNGSVRMGDNLFTCSVVALDPTTGARKWHYQFTPHDTHDWDAVEDVVLADQTINGKKRKLIMQANRNGMFYVLDRTNGQFLFAKPFVKQTWNTGFEKNGRPIFAPGWISSPEGTTVYPDLGGGTNWQSPSYDPVSSWLYVSTRDSAGGYRSAPVTYEEGRQYQGGAAFGVKGQNQSGVSAIDTTTGEVKWIFPIAHGSLSSGVLATGGGVVFAATPEGNLIALDSKSGKSLWHFQTGGRIASSPISYAVDGKQYIAISAGNVLYTFALPE
ncbi:MAG: PQQ-dependent dehydrogenase, methanol/ethanol family [Granulicella sp.]